MPAGRSARRASVQDVARVAAVSVGTVSNVLNRPESVRPVLRERVEAAIAELGFVRNGVARQLRAGTLTTVGALVLDIRNPFFTEVARGIEDRLSEDDYLVMLASSDDDPAREARYLRLFEERGVAGLLVVPGSAGLAGLRAIHQRGVPMVLLDSPARITGVSSVSVDDTLGAAMAVRHLLDQGHRQVVFLNGPHTIRQCAERSRGAVQAVRDAGLDPHEVLREVRIASLDAGGGDSALRELVDAAGGVPPQAVFCVNDLVAIGVQRALRLIGGTRMLLRTSVVGYDDLDISSELAVPLTSVSRPAQEMGRRAADLLLQTSAGGGARRVVFEPELVVRASSTHRG
jgi:LacI family transcriptional regulator